MKRFHYVLYLQSIRPGPHLLSQLSKVLKLSRVQETAFAIALLNSSNADTRSSASNFLKAKLPQLIYTYIDSGKWLCHLLEEMDMIVIKVMVICKDIKV